MDSVFAELYRQIDEESKNKEVVREIEHDYSVEVAPYKSRLQISAAPASLQVSDYRDELVQVYKKYLDRLASVEKADRLATKITEDIYSLYFINGYFLTVAATFAGDLSAVSVSLMAVLPTPAQFSEAGLAGPNGTVPYASYLIGMLSMVEAIADYTSDAIINISMGSADKRQYCIAPLNLQMVSKISTGFQMLDLKNDAIRRKFDGLKYQVKKINGVVYDLSLRGLITVDVKVEDA
ncbi:hypothetical protein DICA3_D18734 [Diutina catenulata]